MKERTPQCQICGKSFDHACNVTNLNRDRDFGSKFTPHTPYARFILCTCRLLVMCSDFTAAATCRIYYRSFRRAENLKWYMKTVHKG